MSHEHAESGWCNPGKGEKLKLLLIFGLFAGAPAFGQVQVDAGASSIYSSNRVGGAGIDVYGQNQQVYIGGSVVNGHFIPGGFERFGFHDSVITAGSQSLAYSFDGIGIGLSCVCVSIRPKIKKQLSISTFFGSTSPIGFFFPWATATPPTHFGSGVVAEYKFDLKQSPVCKGIGCSDAPAQAEPGRLIRIIMKRKN